MTDRDAVETKPIVAIMGGVHARRAVMRRLKGIVKHWGGTLAGMKEPNPASVATAGTHASSTGSAHHGHRHSSAGHSTASAHHKASFHAHVDHAAHRASTATQAAPSADVTQAVRTAMDKEGVPSTWEADLNYIIERESTGKVGATNSKDSARGLFQLTKSSYHLNPHGAASFGNAVEEAQGGIRYIAQRYQTADNAVGFWKKHGWY